MSAFTEANRKAFDELATIYNTKPWQQALSAQFTKELHTRRAWLGLTANSSEGSKLLDYACGTGVVTKALGADFTTIRGIDISEKMVELYNAAAAQSSGDERPVAVVGDLLSTPHSASLAGSEWRDFDLAVICAGFHHFESPGEAVQRLVERLRPGGQLLIVDFLPFDDEVDRERKLREQMEHTHGPGHDFPDMTHTIKHSGFNEAQMSEFYTAAGLTDFGFNLAAEASSMELKNGKVERWMFFAKGRKAA
ncbi:hypothetical protein LTR78_006944 [Recurvomyces mirabilis]|uniref:S-adenosyl-L-methionine-dependent methyltransferase n=1 Tax=Recurvomyces mirabilis TaxID=574656 RepID=A0AAE0WJZ4_9PEZI|nr:hypothetical protein LTR78_006944 [Recurvomyces mirabilis]KAK5153328.1 hypothetical protein LTS14_007497 [Recurvomyces mirabilis]